jgi:hypothetical protein
MNSKSKAISRKAAKDAKKSLKSWFFLNKSKIQSHSLRALRLCAKTAFVFGLGPTKKSTQKFKM